LKKAFAGHARVGIISVENREYDPKRWWKYSEGVKKSSAKGWLFIRPLHFPSR